MVSGNHNMDELWKKAFKARIENEKKGVYGKHIIKNVSDLKSLFSLKTHK